MTSTILKTIEEADLEESKAEYRQWVQSVAILVDSVFSQQHQDSFLDQTAGNYLDGQPLRKSVLVEVGSIDRLCDEFETVFCYAKYGEVKINGELAYLQQIEQTLKRYFSIGRLTWCLLNENKKRGDKEDELNIQKEKLEKLKTLSNAHHSGRKGQLSQLLALGSELGLNKKSLLNIQDLTICNHLAEVELELWQLFGTHMYLDQTWDRGNCYLIDKHAHARFQLDFTHYISLEEIAVLAGFKEKRSVWNAISTKAVHGRLNLANIFINKYRDQKLVECEEARNWLNERRKFEKTISADSENHQIHEEEKEEVVLIQVQHFVPVANDGTSFDPVTCKSPSGYIIGEKGKEEKFDSYLEALVELQKMATPRWRRPSEKSKRFGIVKGVGWERKSDDELGLENLLTGAENLASILGED